MSESNQHKLDRVRRPRVQITYDVETEGATVKTELPFLVGVMADLSGQPKEPLPSIKERDFVEIDRDNFNQIMSRQAPRVAFRVNNKLTNDGSMMNVELNFKSMDDFDPGRIAEQVPALKKMLEMRNNLEQLKAKMEGNDKLVEALERIIGDNDAALKMAKEAGLTPPAQEGGAQ